MAEERIHNHQEPEPEPSQNQQNLDAGAYEVITRRLHQLGDDLLRRIEQFNQKRKDIFGALDSRFIAQDRIITDNNCLPRDMIPVGNKFVLGYKVNLGLKSTHDISDVFSVYEFNDNRFENLGIGFLDDPAFKRDLQDLYSYYKKSSFLTFSRDEAKLLMIFKIGENIGDIRAFKWSINNENNLKYINARADHEVKKAGQHDFEWIRTTRENHIYGRHPHISIEDRIFVECIEGDLTIKVENNTDDGAGIYSEPVENKDQTLDDAEISYAIINHMILLRIKPYREKDYRYLICNEKIEKAVRVDEMADCAILLPENDGLIFPRGYYLENGEYKKYDQETTGMRFRRMFSAPNGEDFLYVFYNDLLGEYALLQYNIIEKKVKNPIYCNGFAIYDDGKMFYFIKDEEPKKNHAIQIWQTPFAKEALIKFKEDSILTKIGNKELVKGIAELRGLYNLINTEKTYLGLYHQIVKRATKILDFYHWLDQPDVFNPKEILIRINDIGKNAIDEYEKVVQIKAATENSIRSAEKEVTDLINNVSGRSFDTVEAYVDAIARLKSERGKIITLKELRYVDQNQVNSFEIEIKANYERLAKKCVDFLLRDTALQPFYQKLDHYKGVIPVSQKVTELKEYNLELDKINNELTLLMELVNDLKIEDATQSSRIIEGISKAFSYLNQIKAIHKKQTAEIQGKESYIEFGAQFKLLSQAALNFIDQADTPLKCEALLTRIMVQFEELEGKFSDFEEFSEKINEKREEIYSAFNTKKVQLQEAINKKSQALINSAERILKGIEKRANQFSNINDLNAYFAGDAMVTKIEDIIDSLHQIGDSVKAEDIAGRIKSLKQEGSRQLKDKLDLFSGGDNVISFGQHQFMVNKQNVDLTIIKKTDDMFFHITGTGFFEKVEDEAFFKTRKYWDQLLVSETPDIYRAEFLAYKLLKEIDPEDDIYKNKIQKYIDHIEKFIRDNPKTDVSSSGSYTALFNILQDFAAQCYTEGYEKGIHDLDALKIFIKLFPLYRNAGTMRFHPTTRAYGAIFWFYSEPAEEKKRLGNKIRSLGLLNQVTRGILKHDLYINELKSLLKAYYEKFNYPVNFTYMDQAAEYLFEELQKYTDTQVLFFPVNKQAFAIYKEFRTFLEKKGAITKFNEAIKSVSPDIAGRLAVCRDWVSGFVKKSAWETEYFLEEAVSLVLGETMDGKIEGDLDPALYRDVDTSCKITGLLGQHPRIQGNELQLDISDFLIRLDHYIQTEVPLYNDYLKVRERLIEKKKESLRLDEFKPMVMSSFVRNKLIDKVYLPLIGANLAKQIGAYGEKKRTDLMGLLLLISPPGYGKTTLMEYLSNRLGLIFMKINCPSIGHQVTSLDPAQANNATSREEVEKLNLALEMGNNVMLYLDDIQHTNPEFLQKFISLCDAQRKIEGVYKGKSRTYDLRGKRFAVIMAGNPYTESGQKFQIPDMLVNRADVYNLGDILGGYEEFFRLSYLENALTSNSSLASLASKSQKDVYAIIRIAETGVMTDVEFETNYSQIELNEYVAVFKKLLEIQKVVLKVNQLYIYSAGQDDAFRTEPHFLLQGSYRNMNKLAEKVVAIMNETELNQLILNHYTDDAQILTKGAEFNLLRFKEMQNWLTAEETERLLFIRKSYQKNKTLGNLSDKDAMGQIVGQINLLNDQFGKFIDIVTKSQ